MLETASGRAFSLGRIRRLIFRLRWIGLLGAGFVIFLPGCSSPRPPAAARRSGVPVTVASAISKDVPVDIRVIGTVEPFSTVAVKSQVTGELKEVYFRQGDEIKEGDRLFHVDPRPFEWE